MYPKTSTQDYIMLHPLGNYFMNNASECKDFSTARRQFVFKPVASTESVLTNASSSNLKLNKT